MKHISVLGSTGSIGTQTLDVIRHDPGHLSVVCLAARGSDPAKLAGQIAEFQPRLVCVYDHQALPAVREALSVRHPKALPQFTTGMQGLRQAASLPEADIVVTAMVGMIGIEPTVCAINAGKTIALANKETLACAGSYVMALAKDKGVRILPVDSEHSAVFQCLQGVRRQDLSGIWLTASGGPFRGYTRQRLEKVTLEEALHHPNWSMGAKITIDSATLMNKGTEMIEAMYLYSLEPDQIWPVVHPQSLVHSMIQLKDSTVLAQLGPVDMRLPIQVMLNYPERGEAIMQPLDFRKVGPLTFEPVDEEVFVSIPMARWCMRKGGLFPACYNAANEIAVERFRRGEISFTGIYRLVEKALNQLDREETSPREYELEEIIGMRERTKKMLGDPV